MNAEASLTHPEQQAKIDWSEIRQRAQSAQDKLSQGAAPSPEESRAILKARARALAREPQGVAAGQTLLEILEFCLASETIWHRGSLCARSFTSEGFHAATRRAELCPRRHQRRGEILSVV